MRAILAGLAVLALAACSQVPAREEDGRRRIVSLDFCADQYVLRFARRADILALGGEIRFQHKVVDLTVQDGRLRGLVVLAPVRAAIL